MSKGRWSEGEKRVLQNCHRMKVPLWVWALSCPATPTGMHVCVETQGVDSQGAILQTKRSIKHSTQTNMATTQQATQCYRVEGPITVTHISN